MFGPREVQKMMFALQKGVPVAICVKVEAKCEPPQEPKPLRDWNDPTLDPPRDPSMPDPSVEVPALKKGPGAGN